MNPTATVVKEHGLIFAAEMVRALLDGRKTQTRRIIKPQPTSHDADYAALDNSDTPQWWLWRGDRDESAEPWERLPKCPYQVGDSIWVREAFDIVDDPAVDDPAAHDPDDGPYEDFGYKCPPIAKRGPNGERWVVDYAANVNTRIMDIAGTRRWKPSIHMPRWASRITLAITDVLAARVQDISEEDCWAEGLFRIGSDLRAPGPILVCDEPGPKEGMAFVTHRKPYWTYAGNPRTAFEYLWDDINGPDSWDRDWVWALSLKRIEQGNREVITDEYLPAWKKLRKRIAGIPDSEWNWGNLCGTSCCLAGHTLHMENAEPEYESTGGVYTVPAGRILGMDRGEASYVFFGGWCSCIRSPSRQDALEYLDKAIATRNPLVTI